MRVWMAAWLSCMALAYASVASANPNQLPSLRKRADALYDEGKYSEALEVLDEILAAAPKDRGVLRKRPSVLYELLDWEGAIKAYEQYLPYASAGTRRLIIRILRDLKSAHPPKLDITTATGPVTVVIEAGRRKKPVCTAAPSCQKDVTPGRHKLRAERPGFEPWTGQVTVAAGTTTPLVIDLVEKPSQLTVRGPTGATIKVNGNAYDGPAKLPAGKHRVVVTLDGHRPDSREIVAREGAAIDLDIELIRIVPVQILPATATPTITLDGTVVTLEEGGLALPPGAHTLVVAAKNYQVEPPVPIPAERDASYQITVALDLPPPPPPHWFTLRRKIATASLGVGLAAVTTGVVLGTQANQRDEDARALCPSVNEPCRDATRANELNVAARDRAKQANIAYSAAGVAAAAAVILWFTGAPESQTVVAPQADGRGASVVITRSF